MTLDYNFKFDINPPNIEDVLQKLKDNTGLEIRLTHKGHCFYCKTLGEAVGFYFDENQLIVSVGYDDMKYLLGATLNTLVQMGGEINYELHLPEWTQKRYYDQSNFKRFIYNLNKAKETLVSRLKVILGIVYMIVMIIGYPFYGIYSLLKRQRLS